MPKNRTNKISCNNYKCELEITLELISGKWKSLILWNLGNHKVIRFNEFRRILPAITQKMLTQQLRSLEENALVKRKIYNQVPPIVEYSLSNLGEKLIPILDQMNSWGKTYLTKYKKHL